MTISVQEFFPVFVGFFVLAIFDRISDTFFKSETKPTKEIYHKWTFSVLLLAYLCIAVFSVGEFFLNVEKISLWISLAGVMIYGCGMILRKRAINDLGGNWSLHIEVKEGHELITCGIYRFFKHPYCLAVLFELSGLSLIVNAFYALILVFIIQAPLLLLRIILEEKVLSSHFGRDVYSKNNYKV